MGELLLLLLLAVVSIVDTDAGGEMDDGVGEDSFDLVDPIGSCVCMCLCMAVDKCELKVDPVDSGCPS